MKTFSNEKFVKISVRHVDIKEVDENYIKRRRANCF